MTMTETQPVINAEMVAEIATGAPRVVRTHMTTQVAATFRDAADLLDRPGAWTQHADARSTQGRMIGPNAPGATCWCALGAMIKVAPDGAHVPALKWFQKIFMGGESLTAWNDATERTQAEVVAAFRAAAAAPRYSNPRNPRDDPDKSRDGMKGDLRCREGRLMRHDPQFDDPYLETDRGECPDCRGTGCDAVDLPTCQQARS